MTNNLFVSDYDGTLKPIIPNQLDFNIEAINRLRENGYKFMLSTGRSFENIKNETEKYNIEYDFLVCNNGANIFTGNDNLIKSFYLNPEVVEKLLRKLEQMPIKKIVLNGSFGETKDTSKTVELFIESYVLHFLKVRKQTKEAISIYPDLDLISAFIWSFIGKKGGKSKAIDFLNEIEKYNRIVTVGDNLNDLDMLKSFEGYKVITSFPFLYGKNIDTTFGVDEVATDLINEEKTKKIVL